MKTEKEQFRNASNGVSKRIGRRAMLRAIGLGAGALATGQVLAACAPPAAPSQPSQPVATTGGQAAAPTQAPAAAGGVPKNLELWTFVNTHARWFRAMADDYKNKVDPDFNLKVSEIAYTDMHDKLLVALQAGGAGAPDLADIEQGRFGDFIRGGEAALVDLNERLKAGGYSDQLVPGRQALYSYKGKVYGIEHALTPVVLYYRGDVWDGAGADPTKFETYDDFIQGAKKVSNDTVKATPFPTHDVLLRQRGSDYFDKDGNVLLDSDDSIKTMDWILALRDTHKIANEPPDGDTFNPSWYTAVKDGKYVTFIGADWYAGFFKDNVPELKGKWKATMLPAWEKGGLRTSCWGGTGNCIVKFSKNIEDAWKFQEYTMLSPDANARRFEMTNLFPPLIPAMTDPRLHKPDEYFSGQDLGELFAKVAPDVPPQYQSPYRGELNTKLTATLPDIYKGTVKPADAFKKIADEIRKAMAEGK